MSVPTFSGSYADQSSPAIPSAVAFDVTAGWTGATSFEIDTLPPGFEFDGTDIGGTADTTMIYFIAVRGVNADGPGDWEELKWTAAEAVPTTLRTLLGLSQEWVEVHPSGSGATLFIKTATLSGRQSTWKAGAMLLSDIASDGNASPYNAKFLEVQILLEGATDTYLRATAPGWEIILDTGV